MTTRQPANAEPVATSDGDDATAPVSVGILRRVICLLWQRVVRERNPWVHSLVAGDESRRVAFDDWNRRHIELSRELFACSYAHDDAPAPSGEIVERALDFLINKARP